MAKITWETRTNTGANSRISASIFNEISSSVNDLYDIVEAQLGNTSSTADDDLIISGTIYVSGSIIPDADSSNTSSFDLGSATNAWKDIYVSDGSIKFVKAGESTVSFTKEEVSKLQSGKSISKVAGKQLVNENDDTTYVRMSTAGRAVHYAGGNAAIDIKSDKVTLGSLDGASTGLPVSMPGGVSSKNLVVTGSTVISGSTTISGSTYVVADLLNLLGNYGQTGSFAVTGSSTFTGDTNFDGAVTSTDLLNLLAGFNSSGSSVNTGSFSNSGSFTNEGTGSFTGSVNITGSTEITGALTHQGSTNTMPPPLVVSSPPTNNTLFYGYSFLGGAVEPIQVSSNFVDPGLSGNTNPNSLNYFRFSTSSQAAYGDLTPTSRYSFFEGLEASASNNHSINITFTPVANYPNDSYKFAVTSIVDSSSAATPYYQTNITFIESSSLDGVTAPTNISMSLSGSDGRWKFTILPPEEDAPTGGWTSGDLLNILSAFGSTNIPIGSIGDFNFDGSVNVLDLMMVLGGFGNSNVMCNDVLIPQGTNHQFVGPVISVCEGNVYIVAEGSYSGITP